MTGFRDQRVAMTSLIFDDLNDSCASPRDQRVVMTTRSSDRVEDTAGEHDWPSIDQHVALTTLLIHVVITRLAGLAPKTYRKTTCSPDCVQGTKTDSLDRDKTSSTSPAPGTARRQRPRSLY